MSKIQSWQILHVDGRIEERSEPCPDLDALQAIVGGNIQIFYHGETPYVCNEDGREMRLPANPNSPGTWDCVGVLIRGLEVD